MEIEKIYKKKKKRELTLLELFQDETQKNFILSHLTD
jgi:hypothetical protein